MVYEKKEKNSASFSISAVALSTLTCCSKYSAAIMIAEKHKSNAKTKEARRKTERKKMPGAIKEAIRDLEKKELIHSKVDASVIAQKHMNNKKHSVFLRQFDT